MTYIDCHTHLHDSRILRDVKGIISRAEDAGVSYMATCATMEENFETTAALAGEFKPVLPFFGIHPWFIGTRSTGWKNSLAGYLERCPSGVGETGLDFTNKSWNRDDQTRVFRDHLNLARELRRPINIHIRKAWDTFIHILKKDGRLTVPGMVHSYSGSADLVPVLGKMNLYISFSGSITNPSAKKVAQSLSAAVKGKFVLETDTPDINPFIDGRRLAGLNEPQHIPAIARIASERIGMEKKDFMIKAYENSRHLFRPILKASEGV